jgi:hypothetical protein
MAPPSPDPVDIDWLVTERSRIQRLSSELLGLMKSKDEILADARVADAVLLMVGATFSLWRAIFLAHTMKTLSRNFAEATDFLEKWVRHNSISYWDDFNFQAWSFGYYLNNCKFRLKPILSNLELEIMDSAWLDEPLLIDTDAQGQWTKHCDVLQAALVALTNRLSPSE